MSDNNGKMAVLALAALGIVFGDIGTSPLYAFKEVFSPAVGIAATKENVLGVLSLMTWAMFLVICVKYAWFVMKAENEGEGGTMALMALLSKMNDGRGKAALMAAGLFATALFFGDGAITPAISVLSAMEGLKVAMPEAGGLVVPLSMTVLIALFMFQSKGTHSVGKFFGPTMIVWFLTLFLLGTVNLVKDLSVVTALNPMTAISFMTDHPKVAGAVAGAVILVLTGVEALYADMGHFGRMPILLAWYTVALPALLVNYYGQGALVISDPSTSVNPFFMMAPEWFQLPLVAISGVATIIASQAVISGVFSMTRQAISLGFLPRMGIEHTSDEEAGQIYIPAANWILLAAVSILVIGFGSSDKLAAAYGLAVNGAMIVDGLLAAAVFRVCFKWSWLSVGLFALVFATLELTFLGANLHKVIDGGWLPIAIGVCLWWIMSVWKKGRTIVREKARRDAMSLNNLVETLVMDMPHRVHGTSIFMNSIPDGVPPALLHNLKHNQVLHETVLVLNVNIAKRPRVPQEERLCVTEIGSGFWSVKVSYGFAETPNIPSALSGLKEKGVPYDESFASFFLGRETIIASKVIQSGMNHISELVFVAMNRNAGDAVKMFRIPPGQAVEMGARVEI